MNQDEREALRQTVTRLYEHRGDPRRPELTSAQVWGQLRDLGLLAIVVPSDHGGSGGDLVDAGLVCEVRGYSCDFGAYPETVGISFGLASDEAQAQDDVPAGVSSMLHGVSSGGWQLVPLQASDGVDDLGRQREGVYTPVDAEREVAIWKVGTDGDRHVVRFEDVSRLDPPQETRSTSRQDERKLTVSAADAVGNVLPLASEAWSRALMAMEALRYAEIVGACRWLQQDARRYATERVQFGQPIGQFQAVQHQLVDMLAWVDAAELLVRNALKRIQEGAGASELTRAGAFVRDRLWGCLFGSYTVLGGMGFIEEMPVNTYCRRLLGVLSQLGPISEIEQQSAEEVVPGGWLPQRA